MNDRVKAKGRSFLLEVSSDESWIDASSLYVKNKLAELLRFAYEEGKNESVAGSSLEADKPESG